jgi:hypothetical protein
MVRHGFSDELAAKFKEYGLVATLVTVKIQDEQRPSVECVRIALPFPEYVAKRLSEHTGREVTPRETGNFTRFETGPHPYFALEYGLATESWCTMLKKADAPAGLLFRCFERIRQGWLDEGGYFYPAPQPETEANAEQATQDASEEEMPTA